MGKPLPRRGFAGQGVAHRVQERKAETAYRKNTRRGRAVRGTDPENTILDLVLEDQSRVSTVYFLMSEDNIKKQIKYPWVSFGSDAESRHRKESFSNRSRTREPMAISLACLVNTFAKKRSLRCRKRSESYQGYRRRISASIAAAFSKRVFIADLVIFDPKTIADKADLRKTASVCCRRGGNLVC